MHSLFKLNGNANGMHVQTTQATKLPVKLDDVKAYSYITGNEDDSLLQIVNQLLPALLLVEFLLELLEVLLQYVVVLLV